MKQPFKETNSKLSWVKPSLRIHGTVQQMTEGFPIQPNGSACPDGLVFRDGGCFPEQDPD